MCQNNGFVSLVSNINFTSKGEVWMCWCRTQVCAVNRQQFGTWDSVWIFVIPSLIRAGQTHLQVTEAHLSPQSWQRWIVPILLWKLMSTQCCNNAWSCWSVCVGRPRASEAPLGLVLASACGSGSHYGWRPLWVAASCHNLWWDWASLSTYILYIRPLSLYIYIYIILTHYTSVV